MTRPARVSLVFLAGGYGTRLYPLTKKRPKAMLPLGEGVIMDAIWSSVKKIPSLSRVVLVSNHRYAAQFDRWARARGAAIQIVDNGTSTSETRLGAIRDLQLGLACVGKQDDVLALGTDNLFGWSLADFIRRGGARRRAVTIAVRKARSLNEAKSCGVVSMRRSGRIRRCVEKPAKPFSLTVSLCVYYIPPSCRASLQAFIRAGGNVDAPGYFIAWLVTHGSVYGFLAHGAWSDIGSREAYHHVAAHWDELKGELQHA